MARLRTNIPLAAAGLAVAVCALFWVLFDRMYPRIPPGLFALVEGLLLAAAVILGGAAWRSRRDGRTLALLVAALAGAGLWALAASLGLRWIP